MRKLLAAVSVVGAMCVALPSQAQNLLSNGNLDLTAATEIVPAFFLPKPQAWQNIGTRTISGPYEDEMSSEPWAGPAPTPVTLDGNLNPPHPEGCGGPDCAVFFKPFSGNATNGPATGHLFQDVPAAPGQRYTLTGWFGAEPNVLMADAELAIEFLNGASAIIPLSGQTLSVLPTLLVDNGQPFDYKQYSVSATAPAGAVAVRARASMIGATGNPAGGGQAFVVDDFVLTAVPEPSAMILGLAGFLGLASLKRRG
jgi:hypothetical protein